MIKRRKRTNRFEFGRTMLELIAVVTLLCLLTIGGIKVFRNAVSQQTADRLYEDIRLEVLSYMNRGVGRRKAGMTDTSLGGKSRAAKDMAIQECPLNAVTVRVKDVDEATCEKLLEKDWEKPFKLLGFYHSESWED